MWKSKTFLVLRALGQFPISRPSKRRTSPSRFLMIFYFVVVVTLLTMVALSFRRLPTINVVLRIANDIVAICALCSVMSTLFCPIFCCKKICAMFDVVDAIDERFAKLQAYPDNSVPEIHLLFFVFFSCLLFIGSVTLENLFPLWSDGLGAGFYIYQLFCVLIHVFLCNILYVSTHLKVRFLLLNNLLERMKKPKRAMFQVSEISSAIGEPVSLLQKTSGIFYMEEELVLLKQCHLLLYQATRQLNSINSPIMILLLIHVFIESLVNCYRSLSGMILHMEDDKYTTYLVSLFNWCLIQLMRSLALILICNSVVNEADKTSFIIHTIHSSMRYPPKQLQMFSLQILHHGITFSPFGLFPIDMSLFLTMIGAGTSYLVVIMGLRQEPAY